MTVMLALVAAIILLALSVFQAALVFGAKLGHFAWGGQHKVLPMKLRVASAYSIFLYVLFTHFILARAGAISTPLDSSLVVGVMWALTGYFFLGIFVNAISRSKPERFVMTPVAATLAVLFLVVSLS